MKGRVQDLERQGVAMEEEMDLFRMEQYYKSVAGYVCRSFRTSRMGHLFHIQGGNGKGESFSAQ